VLYGDIADGAWYAQLMREHSDIAALREAVVFGQAFADADAANALDDVIEARRRPETDRGQAA
jgi:nitrite reductase (NADH) large subunit